MRICQLAAEAAPFAKTGGLGDVVSGLSRMLGRAGHDVRVFLPHYGSIAKQGRGLVPVEFIREVPLALGGAEFRFTALTGKLPGSDVDIYFIDCPALFGGDAIYSDGWNEHRRFALLTLAGLSCCQRMGWGPEIVHVHDWHTALAPIYLRSHFAWDRLFASSRTVLTVHNLGYHGLFGSHTVGELGLWDHRQLLPAEDLAAGQMSFLKAGLLTADLLTTVSRTYAQEIQTAEQGFGLDGLLRWRSGRLVGIVNGVDYDEWNPAVDPFIPHHYSPEDLDGKLRMKRALLDRIGLAGGARTPVVGMVNRMIAQKGLDLAVEVLPQLLARRDFRFVGLGSGEPRYEEFFLRLQSAFPSKVWTYRGYHNELAHWIEAGADLFLMPSLYEPCGLNQMYSLKYGTPPVVRRVGGLADTVEPYDWQRGTGTGFVFDHFAAAGLGWALEHALSTFEHPEAWRGLMRRGMAQDFSWQRQGALYLDLYRRLAAGEI